MSLLIRQRFLPHRMHRQIPLQDLRRRPVDLVRLPAGRTGQRVDRRTLDIVVALHLAVVPGQLLDVEALGGGTDFALLPPEIDKILPAATLRAGARPCPYNLRRYLLLAENALVGNFS